MVISAIGQLTDAPDWLSDLGIDTNEQGVIVIDEQGRTSNPKIYAGGDNTHGPDLVVTAIAAGRCAAEGIVKSFQPVQKIKEIVGVG